MGFQSKGDFIVLRRRGRVLLTLETLIRIVSERTAERKIVLVNTMQACSANLRIIRLRQLANSGRFLWRQCVLDDPVEFFTADFPNDNAQRDRQTPGFGKSNRLIGVIRRRIVGTVGPPFFKLLSRPAGMLRTNPFRLILVEPDTIIDSQGSRIAFRRAAFRMDMIENLIDVPFGVGDFAG